MTVLDANMYRDPFLVLQEKQQAELKRKAKCGKCVHYQSIVINFHVHHGCIQRVRNWQGCTMLEAKGCK